MLTTKMYIYFSLTSYLFICSLFNPSIMVVVHCTVCYFRTCGQPQHNVSWMHSRVLQIQNPSILGSSWNLNPSITEGLMILSVTYMSIESTAVTNELPCLYY